jgi:hypothetical protein
VETSRLLAELDALLLEIRRRLDDYVERGRDDIVAADEGFAVAGLLQASIEAASAHAREARAQLERSHSHNV